MTLADLETPGVHVRGLESDPAVRTTAVTAFVGVAARGPLHVPQRIRSWGEFLQVFGDVIDHGVLAHEVYGFFRNGGIECHVARIADLTDHASENQPGRCPRVDLLQAAANAHPIVDLNGDETMAILALNEGSWGNRLTFDFEPGSQQQMPLTRLAVASAAGTTTVRMVDPFDLEPGMTLRIAMPDTPVGGRIVVVQSVNASTGDVTLESAVDVPLPRDSVVFGRGFKLMVRGDETEIFDDLSMTPTHERYFAAVVNGPDDVVDYVEKQSRGHSILVRLEQLVDPGTGQPRFRPQPPADGENVLAGGGDGFRHAVGTMTSATAAPSITVLARAEAEAAGVRGAAGNRIRVAARPFATELALPIPLADGSRDRIVVENADGLVPGDSLQLSVADTPSVVEVLPGNLIVLSADLNDDYQVGAPVGAPDRFTLEVFLADALEPAEVHRNLSTDPANARFFVDVLESGSVLLCGDPPAGPLPPPEGEILLSGGRGPGDIDYRWYTGYDQGGHYFVPSGVSDDTRLGLAAFEADADADLVAVPDLAGHRLQGPEGGGADVAALYQAALAQILVHCRELGDRLALLDPRETTDPDDVAVLPRAIADLETARYGALYYPWLDMVIGEARRRVPPSGLVAGLIARSDALAGQGRAPANLPISDVVELEVAVDQDLHARLNATGVNCARKFDRPSVELWGARTLSTAPNDRYVSARRIVLALRKALSRTLLWSVFEPNTPALRQRIRAALQTLLQGLVAKGMTASSDEARSFYVKCDEETNARAVLESGALVAEIGIALIQPAEFLVLTVKRTPSSLSVTEDGG